MNTSNIMKLYLFLHDCFNYISCKTLPENGEADESYEEIKDKDTRGCDELLHQPRQFFMER